MVKWIQLYELYSIKYSSGFYYFIFGSSKEGSNSNFDIRQWSDTTHDPSTHYLYDCIYM